MEQQLIRNIDYCKDRYGWTVTVKDFYGLMLRTVGVSEIMRRFINHENDYCRLVKSKPACFSHCVDVSNNNLRTFLQSSPAACAEGFYGVCYAGVREYVVPVFCDNVVIGAVIVGALRCAPERRKTTFDRLEREFGFERPELEASYRKNLRERFDDPELIRTQAGLWALSLQLLCEKHIARATLDHAIKQSDNGRNANGSKLNQALLYINNHISGHITVKQIARVCYCSESSIAHIFKEHFGMGINAFIIQERLSMTRRMLAQTNLPVSEIAAQCGFVSNKYLTAMFKRKLGVTPTQYRAQNRATVGNDE